MSFPMTFVPLFSAAHLQRRDLYFRRQEEEAGQKPEPRDDLATYYKLSHQTTFHYSYDNDNQPRTNRRKTRKRRRMSVKPPTWISVWFMVTVPVIIWDAFYCFMRPRSFEGGDLHWIWAPYSIYQNIDLVYGVRAWEEMDGFTNAQSLMNIVETFLNLVYLYLAHVVEWPAAPLIGFTSVSLTLGKTLLYGLQEYYCGYCKVGHNTTRDLIQFWIIPNGIWIVVPSLIVWKMGQDLCRRLMLAEAKAKKT